MKRVVRVGLRWGLVLVCPMGQNGAHNRISLEQHAAKFTRRSRSIP